MASNCMSSCKILLWGFTPKEERLTTAAVLEPHGRVPLSELVRWKETHNRARIKKAMQFSYQVMALILAGNLSYMMKKMLSFCTLESTEYPWNISLVTCKLAPSSNLLLPLNSDHNNDIFLTAFVASPRSTGDLQTVQGHRENSQGSPIRCLKRTVIPLRFTVLRTEVPGSSCAAQCCQKSKQGPDSSGYKPGLVSYPLEL